MESNVDAQHLGGPPGRDLLLTLTALLDRDLRTLAREVEAYPSEGALWVKGGEIPNSAGNLVLHVVGNLSHFVGGVLGNTGFQRDRDAEFADRDVPSTRLMALIDDTRTMVREVLPNLPPSVLGEVYPDPPGTMSGVSTGHFLAHLCTHLAYHLGQVNYHRRLTAPS
jgi:hypothetical protein